MAYFFHVRVRVFTGSIIRRLGVTRVIAIGIALQTISVLIALVGENVLSFWAAMALLGLGWNFAFTASANLLTEAHTLAERAKTQAATNFIIFSVVAVVAMSSGVLMQAFGWTWVNLGALPLLAASILAALWLRHWRRRVAAPA